MREAAGKLEQFNDRITSARVVIGKPQHRHHKGDTYSVMVESHLLKSDEIDDMPKVSRVAQRVFPDLKNPPTGRHSAISH